MDAVPVSGPGPINICVSASNEAPLILPVDVIGTYIFIRVSDTMPLCESFT